MVCIFIKRQKQLATASHSKPEGRKDGYNAQNGHRMAYSARPTHRIGYSHRLAWRLATATGSATDQLKPQDRLQTIYRALDGYRAWVVSRTGYRAMIGYRSGYRVPIGYSTARLQAHLELRGPRAQAVAAGCPDKS